MASNNTNNTDNTDSNPENELTPEKLQEELLNYQKAYMEEFQAAENHEPENTEQHIADYFKKNASLFMAQIVWLAQNAESESIQFSASKLGLEIAREDSQRDGDPIKDLLTKLKANAVN